MELMTMGSDDLFHIRKARNAQTLARELAKRNQYDRILIVSEGEKTEPIYFKELRKDLLLNQLNVVIDDRKKGLDPKSLVEYAITLYKKDSDFDHIFCVFDKDKHTTYYQALDIIQNKQLKGNCQLHSITSVPCFEIWLLLHFVYTTRSFETACNDSNCDLVIREITKRGYIINYEKGKTIYSHLRGWTDNAIQHAKQLEDFHKTSGTDNPSTKMFVLVEYLMGLKQQ
jgi:hypothetical protein